MPAKSKAQQRFFGVVKGIQQGTGKGVGKAKKAAKDMSTTDVDDFASTKHKGLPNRIKQETKVRNLIRKMVGEIMNEDFGGAYPKHMRKKFDDKRKIVWLPSVLNMGDRGIIYPEGSDTSDWHWKFASTKQLKEEERKDYPIPEKEGDLNLCDSSSLLISANVINTNTGKVAKNNILIFSVVIPICLCDFIYFN